MTRRSANIPCALAQVGGREKRGQLGSGSINCADRDVAMRVRGEEKRRRRGLTPSRRVDAATDLHGDTRRAGRESAGTALLDWAIALLWPALATCRAIFPASVTTLQLMDPDPRGYYNKEIGRE